MTAAGKLRERLTHALGQALAYDERYELPEGRPAAVLVLIGFSRAGEPALLMTRRTESVDTHKGQMAFPGGVCEADESSDPEATALRETFEEVGILAENVDVVGRLPELHTVTRFTITPVVGILKIPIEDLRLTLSQDEIAEAFWIQLTVLSAPGTYRREFVTYQDAQYPVHVYQVGSHRIWGATGAIIKNMLDRLGTFG